MPSTPRPLLARNPLDRMDQLRPSILAELAAGPSPSDRFVLVHRGRVALGPEGGGLHPGAGLPRAAPDPACAVFLGQGAGARHFALELEAEPGDGFELADLRDLARQGLLPEEELGVLAQACGVLNWHAAQRFCGHCGGPTAPAHGGWRRECASCGRQHFPRTDPVVIMLVTHGGMTLLGCGRNFRIRGMYSCLAGFMEPGETLEDAARRELYEEAGVCGLSVSYVCSQPWPFPSSLMLGLRVEAAGTVLSMDAGELHDLRWASRAEVRTALSAPVPGGLLLPPRFSIAGVLLEGWAAAEGG